MVKDANKLETEANQTILKDMKEILNKHVLKYMHTRSFMALNRCVDELVHVEQAKRLQEVI